LISPLDSACEGKFAFSFSGQIKPATKKSSAAEETISRLGLDISRLRESRKAAVDTFTDESLSQEDFKKFVAGYLKKDASGKISPFWTTIKFLFGDNNRA
ncbi:MAG: TIGR02646 family protein, partial [Phycisphaerae bacterium]